MTAADDQRADQMRTRTEEDQEPPVTTPPPDEAERRVAQEDDETDEIGNPISEADESSKQGA